MTTELRCPECGSLARPDAGWCSLCHADLRTEEEKAAARQVQEWATVASGPAQGTDWSAELSALAAGPDDPGGTGAPTAQGLAVLPDNPTEPSPEVPGAVRGRHARPAPGGTAPADAGPVAPAADPTTRQSEVDRVLAQAGIDVAGMLELLAANESPPLGQLSGRLSSKGQRAIAVLLAAAALTAAGLLVMFVLGLFLH